MISYDPQGKVFVNTARFAFTDPTTKIRYEPGEPVRATPNDWLESQPFMKVQPELSAEDVAAQEAAATAAEELAAAQKTADEKKAADDAAAAQKTADEAKAAAPAKK